MTPSSPLRPPYVTRARITLPSASYCVKPLRLRLFFDLSRRFAFGGRDFDFDLDLDDHSLAPADSLELSSNWPFFFFFTSGEDSVSFVRSPFLSDLHVRRIGSESEDLESLELPRSFDDDMSSEDDILKPPVSLKSSSVSSSSSEGTSKEFSFLGFRRCFFFVFLSIGLPCSKASRSAFIFSSSAASIMVDMSLPRPWLPALVVASTYSSLMAELMSRSYSWLR